MNNYEKIERAKGLIDLINEYDSGLLVKPEREEILEKINKIYGFDLFESSGYRNIMEYFSDVYYSIPSYDKKKTFINWMYCFTEEVICNMTKDAFGVEDARNDSNNGNHQYWRYDQKIDSTMAKIFEDFSKLTDQYVDEKTKISNNEYVMDGNGNLVSKENLFLKGNEALINENKKLEEQKEIYNHLSEKCKLKSELNELYQSYQIIKDLKTLTALENLYLSKIKEIEEKIYKGDYEKNKAENEKKNEIISLCNKTVTDWRAHFTQTIDTQVNEKMKNHYSILLDQDEFALESLNEELTQKESNSNEKNNDKKTNDLPINNEQRLEKVKSVVQNTSDKMSLESLKKMLEHYKKFNEQEKIKEYEDKIREIQSETTNNKQSEIDNQINALKDQIKTNYEKFENFKKQFNAGREKYDFGGNEPARRGYQVVRNCVNIVEQTKAAIEEWKCELEILKLREQKDNINLSKEKEELIGSISSNKESLKKHLEVVCNKYTSFEVHAGIIPSEERDRIYGNFTEDEQNALYEEILDYCTINLDGPSVHM